MTLVVIAFLGVLTWMIVSAVTKANARMRYADRAAALRQLGNADVPQLPSWFLDDARVDQFKVAIVGGGLRAGIHQTYLTISVSEPEIFRIYLSHAANLESRGSSFANQQAAAVELALHMWSNLTLDQKNKLREAGLDL